MNEVLLINKDKDYTSRDIVNIISKKFSIKKVGHFGTLDPLATGLLVIGIGSFTKLEKLLSDKTKEYEVTVLLGTSTTTYDITGNITSKISGPYDEEKIISSLLSFQGKYLQEVPIYSAVKVNGKKLYEYARENKKVTLPKKEVEILSISSYKILKEDENTYLFFKCQVSKGTYIRSLINDLSKKVNIPMCMKALNRTKCGQFDIKDSFKIEDILKDNFSFYPILKTLNIKEKQIPQNLETKILNGSVIEKQSDTYILFKKENTKIAIYGPHKDKMKPYLTFKK